MFQHLSALRIAPALLAAGVAAFAASPADAQPYSVPAPFSAGPNETVTVIAPHFRTETSPLNGPIEPVSLSIPVRYTFRDLVDPARTRLLRWKVWQTANDVCERLAEAYPVYTMTTAQPCIREAYDSAIVKIDARIAGARLAYWYGY